MADFDALKAAVKQDWDAQSEWREDALENFAFLAGHQWTDAEKAAMEENQRVPLVFNRVAVIMSSVAGSEVNNRTEVRFIPREIGDAQPNEVMTAGAEWFRDVSDAEDEESHAFADALTCGLGWTETTLDFDEDPEGDPVITRIDPLEMAWDMHAHRKGVQDARRVHRVRNIPADEAEEMFPGFERSELHCAWIDKGKDDAPQHVTYAGDQYALGDGAVTDDNRDTVTIVQTQWQERERVVEVMLPGMAQPTEISPGKYESLVEMGLPIPARRLNRKVWKQAFLGNRAILLENQPCPDASTFQAVTGNWDMKRRRWYGLLRSMKDPQKYANKWLSQTLHIINSNAKGGVMVEADAVDDPRDFEDSWAAADAVHWLKPGGLGKVQPKDGPQFPAALMNLTEFAISSIRDASGVNMELLGLRDANQPGVLEYQRRQSAMTTLAGYFDALRFYRKRQGRVILHFLREHIAPTGRLVRLVEDGQARYVPLAMDEGTARYDVIVDDAPSAPNQKEKNWEIISQLLPVFADKMNAEDWALVAEYSPLPAALTERLKERAQEQRDQGPDPMQMQMAQLEMAKVQSEIAENQANARENTADAMVKEMEAGLAPMRANADAMEAAARARKTITEADIAPFAAMTRSGSSPA